MKRIEIRIPSNELIDLFPHLERSPVLDRHVPLNNQRGKEIATFESGAKLTFTGYPNYYMIHGQGPAVLDAVAEILKIRTQ